MVWIINKYTILAASILCVFKWTSNCKSSPMLGSAEHPLQIKHHPTSHPKEKPCTLFSSKSEQLRLKIWALWRRKRHSQLPNLNPHLSFFSCSFLFISGVGSTLRSFSAQIKVCPLTMQLAMLGNRDHRGPIQIFGFLPWVFWRAVIGWPLLILPQHYNYCDWHVFWDVKQSTLGAVSQSC